MKILILNAGSATLKYKLFAMPAEDVLAEGSLDHPGGDGIVQAAQQAIETCRGLGIDAVGHRVVHGGARFVEPTRITPDVLKILHGLAPLDPLHNPTEVAMIEAAQRALPDAPSVAVFDTAFHRTLPEVAWRYAIPRDLSDRLDLRRYGFHGISHRYVSKRLIERLGRGPEGTKLVTCHLGSGASACAIRDGKSVDTSMGLTPLEGLVMGTRSGDIDPGLLLSLLRRRDMTAPELDDLLNHRSGLLGLSGTSGDVRELEKASQDGDVHARLALEVFAYRVRKYIGAYAGALVLDVETPENLLTWLGVVEGLQPEQRDWAFEGDFAQDSCITLVDRLWMAEADKPVAERQWDRILTVLHATAERGRALGIEILSAAAVRAQVTVLSEYLEDIDAAQHLAHETLNRPITTAITQFLVGEAMGRQCGYTGQSNEAVAWLSEALSHGDQSVPLVRLHALLEAARVSGTQDAASAVEYARQGVALARTSMTIPETELVKALAELAISRLLSGDMTGAFEAADDAAERLIASRDDSQRWKALFAVFGHLLGFLSSVALLGKAPVSLSDESAYAAPERGMFLRYIPAMAAMTYDERKYLLFPEVMAMFAAGIGDDERAVSWATRALTTARNAAQSALVASSAIRTVVPSLILADRYGEALDMMLNATASITASNQEWRSGGDPLRLNFDPEAILGSRTEPVWRDVEELAARDTLIPMAAQLGKVALQDAERARTLARQLVADCRLVADSSVVPALWLDAALILEKAFVTGATAGELYAWDETVSGDDGQVLRILKLISGSMQKDTTLVDAFRAHLSALHYIDRATSATSSAFRRVVSPFIVIYWNAAFSRSRFQFITPRLVEKQLQEAAVVPSERQAKTTMAAIADGLGIRLPDWARIWVRESEDHEERK